MMTSRKMLLPEYLLGRVTVEGKGCEVARLLTVCMRYHLPYRDLVFSDDRETVWITMTWLTADTLIRIAAREGLTLRRVSVEGLPEAFTICMRRPGILIGITLALLLTFFASGRLWEIRIEGNHRLSDEQVIRALQDVGLTIGCSIEKLDVDAMENRLLMHSEEISWITINLMGTTAEVQIREKIPSLAETEGGAPANLVASRDGTIVGCEVLNGKIVTQVGRAVRRGELLVSGLYDSAVMGYRYTRARGAIFAETERTFTVEIVYDDKRQVTGERLYSVYTFSFFGASLTLGDREADEATVSIEEEHVLRIFGKALPISITVVRVFSEETKDVRYSVEQAAALARLRLNEEIASIPGLQGIVSKEICEDVGENSYRLICTLRCIEDIAEQKEIALSLTSS